MRVNVQTEQVPQPVKSVEIKDAAGEKFMHFIFCGSSGSVLAYVDCWKASRLSAGELTELIRGLTCLRNRLQEGDIK